MQLEARRKDQEAGAIVSNIPVVSVRPHPKPAKEIKTKRRKKKGGRQLLEIQLDSIVREIVLARDESCVCTPPKNGHSSVRQPGHVISRKNRSVRWGLNNVYCQCSSCNLLHVYKPEYYISWFIARWGGDKFYSMVQDSRVVVKYQTYELLEMLEQLRKIRERQVADKDFRPYYTQAEILSGAWATKEIK